MARRAVVSGGALRLVKPPEGTVVEVSRGKGLSFPVLLLLPEEGVINSWIAKVLNT